MERLFKKRLLQDLKKITSCDLHGLDNNSFSQGYSNGFIKGFFYARKWIIGIFIILAASLIFNFILFI